MRSRFSFAALIAFFLVSRVAVATDDVLVFTITSKSQKNILEWRNPVNPPYASTRIVGRTDRFPINGDDITGAVLVKDEPGTLGGTGRVDHIGLVNGTPYFYGIFATDAEGTFSPGKTLDAIPFATTGPVKWRFRPAGGAVSLIPPGIGNAILYPNNDGNVYAVSRGADGGTWPAGFLSSSPGVIQHRPPVIQLAGVTTSNAFSLVSVQDGFVRAIDAATGLPLWSSVDYGQLQGGPSAWFVAFGGGDLVLVGTRNPAQDNLLIALRAADGSEAWRFADLTGTRIGIVNGTPSIDYAAGRAYFASHQRTQGAHTVFAVNLADGTKAWSTPIGNVSGSPVPRGDKVYVGSDDGHIHGLDAATGRPIRIFNTADGVPKGFPFPDFRGDRLFVSTTNTVWAVRDVGNPLQRRWATTEVLGPSIVLYPPGQPFLWVGSRDGRLYQIDVDTGNPAQPPVSKFVTLGTSTAVGSPSYDVSHSLVYVGLEDGSLFAVAVPF